MPVLRTALLALMGLGILSTTTLAPTGASPLADDETALEVPHLAIQIATRIEVTQYAGTGESVRAILAVLGWSIDGLGSDIAARLTPPPLADALPAWAAPPHRIEGTPTPPPSTAKAVVVMDEASMTILVARAPHERLAPASLTKVATAALAVQSGQLDETVVSTVESWNMPGSSLMGLHTDDRFSLRDLVYGMMLPSGNDAALAIGRHIAGGDAVFVHYLNQMVRHLGLQDTHFTDPHGLGGPGHYSSASDLALLSRYAMQDGNFREVVGAQDWTAHGSSTISMSSYVRSFMNRVEGADGLKTGFTYEAGPTFIGSAVRDGHRLYVVLLNSQDRFGEAAALLEWAFQNHQWPSTQQVATVTEEEDGMVQAARHQE